MLAAGGLVPITLNSNDIGKILTCGYCGIEHAITMIVDCDGGLGFELACGHRSGYCSNCQMVVPNASKSESIIIAACPKCSLYE